MAERCMGKIPATPTVVTTMDGHNEILSVTIEGALCGALTQGFCPTPLSEVGRDFPGIVDSTASFSVVIPPEIIAHELGDSLRDAGISLPYLRDGDELEAFASTVQEHAQPLIRAACVARRLQAKPNPPTDQ